MFDRGRELVVRGRDGCAGSTVQMSRRDGPTRPAGPTATAVRRRQNSPADLGTESALSEREHR